jgi:hypothetical protein
MGDGIMYSQRHDRRFREDHASSAAVQAVEPALRRVNTDEEAPGRQSGIHYTPSRASCTEPDQASRFIRGLSIALPLSISLWAFMIWGIQAIW